MACTLHIVMISVENFYWILYENLLAPVGLDCWYYSPFGTTQNLNRHEFRSRVSKMDPHVLFYFDQEPIWQENFGPYDLEESAWKNLTCKLLANSEISKLKKEICQHRGMIDWYFFYHGFAALDWFRDCAFICTDQQPTRVFCSFNHHVSDFRAYRMLLTAHLKARNILKFGDVSFHGDYQLCEKELCNSNSYLSDSDKTIIAQNLLKNDFQPLLLDGKRTHMDWSARFGHWEYKLWQRSLVHLVNETVFYHEKLHLTEKIFKPIVSLRPFLLAGSPGNLAYLRSYGFQTFDRWWDESYDRELDTNLRIEMLVDILTNLCSKSPASLIKMHQEMQPILLFNKQHFFGQFRRAIINELVDNFDWSVHQWNHARVDGRDLPKHPSLDMAKQKLLG